ncbi:MAG TPA: hypothetical protein VEN47_03190, partial [Myxococcota bacterium]|nr:hypothetical protein [Myxococcota bacterium]
MFDAAFFEALGRRVGSAPRAAAAALVALCAIASPGAVRLGLAAPVPASGGETLLFELSCDAGIWSSDCVEQVDSLSRELLASRDLIEGVDSLATRQRVIASGHELALA